jgi:hypothetical protein
VITNGGRISAPDTPARAPGTSTGVAWIVEEQTNPSTDYYVEPALRSLGFRTIRSGLTGVPDPSELNGAVVVFVRYISPAWRSAIEKARGQMAGLVYFMDDDLLDTQATVALSVRYRWKIWRMAGRHQTWLKAQRASLWVSTDALAHKYAPLKPKVVCPSPLPKWSPCRRIFYHGSESHRAEIEWLVPVVGAVLAAVPDAVFEVIGDKRVRQLFAGIPRVTVLHPMKWPTYLGLQATGTHHIGLAPLIDSTFNQARSHTRFFDYTRMGAAGIYSESSACAAVVTTRHDGIVVPMDRSAWIDAIQELVSDEGFRSSVVANAQVTATRLGQVAAAGFGSLRADVPAQPDQHSF